MSGISRERALARLLQPVIWSDSSSVRSRQNAVDAAHRTVDLIYPFLDPAEKALADAWRKVELHAGLWH